MWLHENKNKSYFSVHWYIKFYDLKNSNNYSLCMLLTNNAKEIKDILNLESKTFITKTNETNSHDVLFVENKHRNCIYFILLILETAGNRQLSIIIRHTI